MSATAIKTPCGTRAGYVRHLRDETDPCASCRDANRVYVQRWRHRTGRSQPGREALVAEIHRFAVEELPAADRDRLLQVLIRLGALKTEEVSCG